MRALFTSVLCLCLSWAGTITSSAMEPAQPALEGKAFRSVSAVKAPFRSATALFLEGNLLCCGSAQTVYLYDVSTPAKPALVGECRVQGKCRQITGANGYLYVATRETGLWVIDIHDPAAPRLLTRYDPVELATGVSIGGNVLFISLRQNGVEFVDVSDPARPQHIRRVKTSESQSNFYHDGYLYSGDWARGEISVIDARDCETAAVTNLIKLRGNGDGVWVQGDLLYAATGHHGRNNGLSAEENYGQGHGLELYSLNDPVHPRRRGRVEFPKLYRRGNDFWTPRPSGDGKTVFVADTYNGLFAVDVRDLDHPSVIGRIILSDEGLPDPNTKDPLHAETWAPGQPVTSVAVGEGVVYFTGVNFGLGIAKCPLAKPCTVQTGVAPANPFFRAGYPTAADSHFLAWKPEQRGQVRSVVQLGGRLAVACGQAGFYLLEASREGGFRTLAHREGFAGDVAFRGGRLMVAEGEAGLGIYSVRADGSLQERARYKTPDGKGTRLCLWVWAPDEYHAVISDRTSGYVFLDISSAPYIHPIYEFRSSCPGWDRYFAPRTDGHGRWAFSVANQGYIWISLPENGKPSVSRIDRKNRPSLTEGVTNYKDSLFVATIGRNLTVIHPSQEPVPDDGRNHAGSGKKWKGAKGDFSGIPVWDGKDRLALTARIRGEVRMVDFRDETQPELLWKEQVSGNPDTGIFWQGKLVVPCGYQGLLVEK